MQVLIPDLGDFSDVEVIEVLVGPGDEVAPEDALITLETEKAAMDVPSPAAGKVLELRVKVGDLVNAGDEVLLLSPDAATSESGAAAEQAEGAAGPAAVPAGDPPGAPPSGAARTAPTAVAPSELPQAGPAGTPPAAAADAGSAAQAAVAPGPSATGRPARPVDRRMDPGRAVRFDEAGFSRAHASPSVRKLARELGVDLARVTGTAPKGRVTADDVKAHVKRIMTGASGAGVGLPALPDIDHARFGPVETEPLSRIQRISGPRLHASWVNIPHVTQHDEADITELEETRRALAEQARERGVKLTPLAFVLRATVLTLEEFPRFRASLAADGDRLVMKRYMHIGFAADTPNGLVVPVIRDADRKDIYELAEALGELSARARAGKLRADDIQGGVFTISSLGGIGGSFFTPIINAPEVAILGVSRSVVKPVLRDGEFVPRLYLPLSLSYDHRVIDGALAVRFTTRLAERLGQIDSLVEAIP